MLRAVGSVTLRTRPAVSSPWTGVHSSDLISSFVGHSANPRLLTAEARTKSFISSQKLQRSGAWWAAAHGVDKSQIRLSDFTFPFHFHALEKAMATHSSVLAWRIPGLGEPGGLLSIGSNRVGHDGSDSAAAAAAKGSVVLGLHDFK